jgi:hypothetical protein
MPGQGWKIEHPRTVFAWGAFGPERALKPPPLATEARASVDKVDTQADRIDSFRVWSVGKDELPGIR